MSITLSDIAAKTGAKLSGDGSCVIERIDDIASANAGSITFLSNSKYKKYLGTTKASAVIIKKEFMNDCSIPALVTDDPRLLYAKVAGILHPPLFKKPGISDRSVVSDSATIDPAAYIGPGCTICSGASIAAGAQIEPGCVIGENAIIGPRAKLYPNVTIYHGCVIGKNTIIHSGAVIGADGFGFVREGEKYIKIPQVGTVIIGDDVEIGANTTVDRGAITDTIIHDGVKIDNQVQIAHNVEIGTNTVISAATAIAGTTKIGSGCLIGGVVGIVDHITITDNVIITGRSMITRSITEPGSYSSSTPMDKTENWRKNSVRFRQLDEMARRLSKLEKGGK